MTDAGPQIDPPERWNWRVIAVVAALGLVAWWAWKQQTTVPEVPMQNNATPPPDPPAGVPLSLTQKMAMLVDKQIPVVMTSGSAVPYDDDEIARLVRVVLGRLNSMDESVSPITTASVSKTQDSYKTVTYDIVANVHDARARVGLMVFLQVLVPVSGKMYIRQLRLYNDKDRGDGPAAASGPAGPAPYESALEVLAKTKME